MKRSLKLESLAEFLVSIYVFSLLPFAWWWFVALLLIPDLSMIGYLWDERKGAVIYNIFHHKTLAIIVALGGLFLKNDFILLAGVILYAHIAMDRMFGYGLKYMTGFKDTHLGKIGN
jgi:hypothetical protein